MTTMEELKLMQAQISFANVTQLQSIVARCNAMRKCMVASDALLEVVAEEAENNILAAAGEGGSY